MDKTDLLNDLAQFSGTEEYHRMRYPGGTTLLLTDGANYLAEKAGAYWLMDVIASYQRAPEFYGQEFQVWRIEVEPCRTAEITADDGNEKVLARQTIPWTDFPLDHFKLYAELNDYLGGLVILLPSEY
jgi:hypothetical protein